MAVERGDLATALHFLRRLPAALRRRLSHEQALACVRQRLAQREADFLWLLREAVYAQPRHPVRKLLARAGCTHDDVAALVRSDGLEGALAALYRAGVYLSADEVAGRCRVVRGSDSFEVSRADLRNPWAVGQLVGTSGGSRSGTTTAIALDLDMMLDQLPAFRLSLVAAGGADSIEAFWGPPGSIGFAHSLRGTVAFGRPVERWFSPVDETLGAAASPYRWGLRAARLAGFLAGVRLPLPEPVSAVDPTPLLDWIAAVQRRRATPRLCVYPSTVARLCDAAERAGIDLHGVQLYLRGEPVTGGRVAAAHRAGAVVLSLYGAIECGVVGHSCLHAAAVDEVHLHDDLHAIIQPGDDAAPGGLPADALLVTSLRPSARLILLNASLGDQATLDRRACGCALQSYGWQTHLRGIHSFEKLTGMGMTFADAEVTPVLEQVLPARFGGLPTDYQLIEEEAGDGGARLRLIVDPRLGVLDEAALVDTFLDALAQISPTRRMMTLGWRAAGVVRVDRRRPLAAPSGKIMHFRRADVPETAQ